MIFLLRHGEAERGEGDDAARRLTAAGERQASAAGRAIAALGIALDCCLTSPKLRAAETARLACEPLAVRPEVEAAIGRPGLDARAVAAGRGEALLVGHNPDFTTEVARLTGARAKVRKGGLAIIDGSTLVALLRPEDLAEIGAER